MWWKMILGVRLYGSKIVWKTRHGVPNCVYCKFTKYCNQKRSQTSGTLDAVGVVYYDWKIMNPAYGLLLLPQLQLLNNNNDSCLQSNPWIRIGAPRQKNKKHRKIKAPEYTPTCLNRTVKIIIHHTTNNYPLFVQQ